MNGRLLAGLGIETDERVDLEIGKVKVCVDSIEAGEEVDESVAFLGGHVDEERVGNSLAGGERGANRDGEDESLGIDIANVHASLVSEEDRVALACRIDADVIFGVGRVRQEWFDDEIVQGSRDGLDLRSIIAAD